MFYNCVIFLVRSNIAWKFCYNSDVLCLIILIHFVLRSNHVNCLVITITSLQWIYNLHTMTIFAVTFKLHQDFACQIYALILPTMTLLLSPTLWRILHRLFGQYDLCVLLNIVSGLFEQFNEITLSFSISSEVYWAKRRKWQ